eukprot:scaffold81037_cov74-Phaeocystis_antarctica.AAC.1
MDEEDQQLARGAVQLPVEAVLRLGLGLGPGLGLGLGARARGLGSGVGAGRGLPSGLRARVSGLGARGSGLVVGEGRIAHAKKKIPKSGKSAAKPILTTQRKTSDISLYASGTHAIPDAVPAWTITVQNGHEAMKSEPA